jgi:uncharacterized membrane protein
MSTNPYAAAKPAGSDETIVLRDTFARSGRRVPTGNGWNWIAAAWSIFRRAAGMWIGVMLVLFVIYFVFFILYGVSPFVGAVPMILCWPIFTAGLAIMSRTIDQGGNAQFKQLFAGFSHRPGALLTIGVVYLIANFIIAGGVFWLLGVDMSMAAIPADPTTAMMLAYKLTLALLIVMALMLPFVMAVWFAPALVAFHEIGALEAMKESFVGCVKNVLPFLLYGVILFIASVIATIPALLGWLILGPVIAASIYTGYRDIYFTE